MTYFAFLGLGTTSLPMNPSLSSRLKSRVSQTPWNGALPSPLKLLLADELRAGNSIQGIADGGADPDTVMRVLLHRPFFRQPAALPTEVYFRPATTPGAWSSEYYTESPRCVLAA